MTPGDKNRIDEIVEAAVEQGQAPGVVAAVAKGDETYVKAAGVMAVGGPPMRPDTLFRISSTTKPITAAVVLSLVEEGLLDLHGRSRSCCQNWPTAGCCAARMAPLPTRSKPNGR
jgi:CubicO group peptidase (beta-lactamase class C family)